MPMPMAQLIRALGQNQHLVKFGSSLSSKGLKYRNYLSSPKCSIYLGIRNAHASSGNNFFDSQKKFSGKTQGDNLKLWRKATFFRLLGGIGVFAYLYLKESECKHVKKKKSLGGARKKNLPDYRKADILKRNIPGKAPVWVTYKNGVYDITEFLEAHPGGRSKIVLAAGGSVEPFWEMYGQHKTEEVLEILEELRIGNVHPDDMEEQAENKSSNDSYANDPKRHMAFLVSCAKPFNAETPPQLLIDSYNTPNELFFVRNHLPVPKIDIKNYRLEICGKGIGKPIHFTVAQLKKIFPIYTITVAVQCAGNRRSNMNQIKAVKGLGCGTTAIGNAEWTGVKLSDVLTYAGVNEDDVNHVIFEGLDKDIEAKPYEASIPIETAMNPRRDVLLAFEMNGKEIPLDHGYPLRVVVPGVVGARQVKWLSKIKVSKEESQGHFQQKDYKTFNPSIDWDNVDFSKSEAIQDYPIQSAICEPQDGNILDYEDEVTVKGYAWSGGGRGIIRVDVSVDGGKSWHNAELHKCKQKLHQQWGWTIWEATIPISLKGKVEIVAKAVDSSHNSQPDSTEGIWNLGGLIHNAWHRIEVSTP